MEFHQTLLLEKSLQIADYTRGIITLKIADNAGRIERIIFVFSRAEYFA